jgi:hypothetical protein
LNVDSQTLLYPRSLQRTPFPLVGILGFFFDPAFFEGFQSSETTFTRRTISFPFCRPTFILILLFFITQPSAGVNLYARITSSRL